MSTSLQRHLVWRFSNCAGGGDWRPLTCGQNLPLRPRVEQRCSEKQIIPGRRRYTRTCESFIDTHFGGAFVAPVPAPSGLRLAGFSFGAPRAPGGQGVHNHAGSLEEKNALVPRRQAPIQQPGRSEGGRQCLRPQEGEDGLADRHLPARLRMCVRRVPHWQDAGINWDLVREVSQPVRLSQPWKWTPFQPPVTVIGAAACV